MEAVAGGGKNFLHAAWDFISGRKQAPVPQSDCGGFRLLFARSPEAMALLDGSTLAETNPAWDILFGGAEADFPGRPVSSFLPELSFPVQGPQSPAERHGLRRDGARLLLEVSGYPFLWKDRPLFVIVARDISERKAREDMVRKSEQALRKSDGVLRTMLAHSPSCS